MKKPFIKLDPFDACVLIIKLYQNYLMNIPNKTSSSTTPFKNPLFFDLEGSDLASKKKILFNDVFAFWKFPGVGGSNIPLGT